MEYKINKRNIVSFLNMKGGVCKTTLCKEMAYTLSRLYDKRILVIDIDPQSNCTQSFFEKYNVIQGNDIHKLARGNKNLPSIENIFSKSYDMINEPNLDNVIYKLDDKLHIIPSSLGTVFMERETTNGNDQRLLNFIKDNRLKENYNYIFIDCPPTYSFYTISALLATDFYLVPLVPDIYSLLGLDLLNEVVKRLNTTYKSIVEYNPIYDLGVIFTKVPIETQLSKNMKQNMEEIKEEFSNTYFFENKFQSSEKLATNKLETFIIDRGDKSLVNNIKLLSDEFLERMVNFKCK